MKPDIITLDPIPSISRDPLIVPISPNPFRDPTLPRIYFSKISSADLIAVEEFTRIHESMMKRTRLVSLEGRERERERRSFNIVRIYDFFFYVRGGIVREGRVFGFRTCFPFPMRPDDLLDSRNWPSWQHQLLPYWDNQCSRIQCDNLLSVVVIAD